MSKGKAATEIVKFIAEFGITAAKNKFGTSQKTGVGKLTDEQLGQGLNKFEAKKTEKKAIKDKPKDKPTPKPKSPPRNVEGAATQRGLRFRDKPEVDIEVESDASRSVSETNQARGAASAGRSTNAPGKTNIGSRSIANFIRDQKNASPGMAARDAENKAYAAYIKAAPTKAEKAKRQAEFDKIRKKRKEADVRAEKNRRTNISRGSRGKPRGTPKTDKDIALAAIMPDPKTGKGGGELVPEFFKLNKNLRDQLIRSAKAALDDPGKRRLDAILEKESLKQGKTPQLESAGTRKIDTSDRMVQDAKKALVAVFGQRKGTQLFNKILDGSKTKKEFLVEIRSMVSGNSQGQKGTRASETGAIVGDRKYNLRPVDRSNTRQPGRREVTSRRGKPGNTELDSPMNRGGKVTKRATGAHDFRMNKGGLLLSSVDNRKKR